MISHRDPKYAIAQARCLERSDVVAVVGPSCGTCLASVGFSASPQAEKLRARLLRGGTSGDAGCSFAQLPWGQHDTFGKLFGGGLGGDGILLAGDGGAHVYSLYLLTMAAISHASSKEHMMRAPPVSCATVAERRAAHFDAEATRAALALALATDSDDGTANASTAAVAYAVASAGAWPLMLIGAEHVSTAAPLRSWLVAQLGACPAVAAEGTEYSHAKHWFDVPSRCSQGTSAYQTLFGGLATEDGGIGAARRAEGREAASCSFHVDATPLLAAGNAGATTYLSAARIFYSTPPTLLLVSGADAAAAASVSSTAVRLIAIVREPAARTHAWYRSLRRAAVASPLAATALRAKCVENGCSGWGCTVFESCAAACAVDILHGGQHVCRAPKDERGSANATTAANSAIVPFGRWLTLHGPAVLPASVYAPQVAMWRQYFGARLLLLAHHELIEMPEVALARVAKHVGASLPPRVDENEDVDAMRLPGDASDGDAMGEDDGDDGEERMNAEEEAAMLMPCKLQNELGRYFAPHTEALLAAEPSLGSKIFELGNCSDAGGDDEDGRVSPTPFGLKATESEQEATTAAAAVPAEWEKGLPLPGDPARADFAEYMRAHPPTRPARLRAGLPRRPGEWDGPTLKRSAAYTAIASNETDDLPPQPTYNGPIRLPSDMKAPLATVTVLTCNRPKYAMLALRQIMHQDYRPLEALVVDDGTVSLEPLLREAFPNIVVMAVGGGASSSEDATSESKSSGESGTEMPQDELTVRLLPIATRATIGEKRTLALHAARGEVILHWDDDDFHEPRRVSAQLAPIALGAADMTVLELTYLVKMPSLEIYHAKGGQGLLFSSLAYRTSTARSFGSFENVSLGEDYEFADRMVRSCHKMIVVPHITSLCTPNLARAETLDEKHGPDHIDPS